MRDESVLPLWSYQSDRFSLFPSRNINYEPMGPLVRDWRSFGRTSELIYLLFPDPRRKDDEREDRTLFSLVLYPYSPFFGTCLHTHSLSATDSLLSTEKWPRKNNLDSFPDGVSEPRRIRKVWCLGWTSRTRNTGPSGVPRFYRIKTLFWCLDLRVLKVLYSPRMFTIYQVVTYWSSQFPG